MNRKGIDISEHNGNINWSKVKASGIEFAMIRLGYGIEHTDSKAIEYIKGCIEHNIPFGVYYYSYALNVNQAKQEANYVIKTLAPYKDKISYPVAIDMEDADGYKKKYGMPSKSVLTDICYTECEMFENAGYYAVIYANLDWFKNKLDTNKLTRFDKWLAQWNDKPTWDEKFGLWQYSSKGIISGINGYVDLNIAYKDYPSLINKNSVELKKSNEEIAEEVIDGKWGNGEARKTALTEAGYNYDTIQEIVNQKMASKNKKSVDEIAKEVIRGDWGNGQDRKNRLTKAGYDYNVIQARVNQLSK